MTETMQLKYQLEFLNIESEGNEIFHREQITVL